MRINVLFKIIFSWNLLVFEESPYKFRDWIIHDILIYKQISNQIKSLYKTSISFLSFSFLLQRHSPILRSCCSSLVPMLHSILAYLSFSSFSSIVMLFTQHLRPACIQAQLKRNHVSPQKTKRKTLFHLAEEKISTFEFFLDANVLLIFRCLSFLYRNFAKGNLSLLVLHVTLFKVLPLTSDRQRADQ